MFNTKIGGAALLAGTMLLQACSSQSVVSMVYLAEIDADNWGVINDAEASSKLLASWKLDDGGIFHQTSRNSYSLEANQTCLHFVETPKENATHLFRSERTGGKLSHKFQEFEG